MNGAKIGTSTPAIINSTPIIARMTVTESAAPITIKRKPASMPSPKAPFIPSFFTLLASNTYSFYPFIYRSFSN